MSHGLESMESVKIFSVKGGCQNLVSQGHFSSSGHHKNSGGVETPVRAMFPSSFSLKFI